MPPNDVLAASRRSCSKPTTPVHEGDRGTRLVERSRSVKVSARFTVPCKASHLSAGIAVILSAVATMALGLAQHAEDLRSRR